MALLNATYSLLGIPDVERFTARILRSSGLELSRQDREELHVYLIETAWELSLKHDPERGAFSTWVGYALRRRVVDWQRKRYRTRWVSRDRVYERPRVELVSLDHCGHDRLEAALAAQPGDREADSGSALGGLLEDRDRQRARDLDALGLGPYGRVA